jgi:hypothetical protein
VAVVTLQRTRHQAEVDRLLYGPTGPVVRYLQTLGRDIVAVARAEAPVNTGRLRAAIEARIVGSGRGVRLQVGNWTPTYAWYQHQGTAGGGTGYIYPRRAKFLRFEKGGRVIYAKRVRGVRPNPYLLRAVQRVIASR